MTDNIISVDQDWLQCGVVVTLNVTDVTVDVVKPNVVDVRTSFNVSSVAFKVEYINDGVVTFSSNDVTLSIASVTF